MIKKVLRKKGAFIRLIGLSLMLSFVVINLAAQTTYTVTLNSTLDYHIDTQTDIASYEWEAFTDTTLTTPAASTDVLLTSLGTGRENEIQVTWETAGTYYLSVSVTGTDGCVNKMAYTFEVKDNVINQLLAVNDTLSLYAGTSSDINVTNNDIFTGEVTVSVIDDPKHGTYTADADGTITYTANDDYIGKDTLTYVISNTAGSDTALVIINIKTFETNTIVAVWDSATVYGEEIILSVLDNDYDPDEGDIDISSLTIFTNDEFLGPYHGEIVIIGDGTLSYIPEPGYAGLDSFMYRICDDEAEQACDTAIVRLELLFNDGLVANNDYRTIYMGQLTTIDVAHNDYDPEDELKLDSIIVISDPENGNAIPNGDGAITYQPLPSFEGLDSFQYKIWDNGVPQEYDSAWVFINVRENQNVVAVRDDVPTFDEEAVDIMVLNNDYDFEYELDSTSIVIKLNPNHGTVSITDDSIVTYTPDYLFAGLDSFIYQISDLGYPESYDTAWVFIDVIDNNIGILANRDDITLTEGIAATIDVLANDTDADGIVDSTTITITKECINGDAIINSDGTITYAPDAGFIGLDSLIYNVCDDGPIVSCDTAIVYFNVVDNAPPVAINDTVYAYNDIPNTYIVSKNDYDIEDNIDTLSITISDSTTIGILTFDGTTGEIIYWSDPCMFGLDSFTYVIYDYQGNISNEAMVYISIVLDSTMDSDNDGILDIVEDLNDNGNPCDDDTDGDGTPNYMDTDDDGDHILTADEDIDFDGHPENDDTDGDGIPNYLDNDDDNDCILTMDEDFNNNGKYFDDDIDGDGTPNFLDEDHDGDGILGCDENQDLDNNGIRDDLENWNSKAIDDIITIGIDENVVISILDNDSTQMVDSTLYINVNPTNGIVDINPGDWTITYQPNFDYIGIDSLEYIVCDYYDRCDTAMVYIDIEDLIIPPELFTPNNDGENDLYVIRGLERYSNNYFVVYNRWGNKVYENKNYLNQWDGYSNVKTVVGSRKLPVGVYYYILEYGNNREKAGALFLER